MKTNLIIGGSSGIGRHLVKQLSSNGEKVIATYNNNKPEILPDFTEYHKFNVLDEYMNLNFLPDVINGLVYCPGNIKLIPFHRLRHEDLINDYKLQVLGAIKLIQTVLPKLKKAQNASIVLFSTVAVQNGFSFHTQVATSKGAIEGLTRSLAAELAPKIRVNAIAPSLTDTPLAASLLNTEQKREANAQRHPLKRIGKPEDIANMVEFLISDKSEWITGQVLGVDGGMSRLKV